MPFCSEENGKRIILVKYVQKYALGEKFYQNFMRVMGNSSASPAHSVFLFSYDDIQEEIFVNIAALRYKHTKTRRFSGMIVKKTLFIVHYYYITV